MRVLPRLPVSAALGATGLAGGGLPSGPGRVIPPGLGRPAPAGSAGAWELPVRVLRLGGTKLRWTADDAAQAHGFTGEAF
jgi:hypothetical protein